MSCARWREVDLADYVEAPDAAEVAAFDAHVAGCDDCAREVAVWRDMLGALATGVPASHPAPATLLRWIDARERLPGDEAARLTTHLASCAVCADEVAALRSFDFERLAPPAAARTTAGARAGAPGRLDRARAWLAGLAPRPAYGFAGAAVAVALLAWLLATPRRETRTAPSAPPSPDARLARVEPVPPEGRGAAAPAPTAEASAAPPPDMVAAAPTAAAAPALARPAEPAPPAAVRREEAPRSARARDERAPAPAGAEDSAIARAAPQPTSPAEDTATARADAMVDRFLGRTEDGAQAPAAGTGDAVDSSALGFGSGASDGAGGGTRVAALDASRRAVVPESGRPLRLRLQAPAGSAADATVTLTLVAPDGSTSTVAASPRPGSSWREAQLSAGQLRERGRYTLRVGAPDAHGTTQSYDGVLEVR